MKMRWCGKFLRLAVLLLVAACGNDSESDETVAVRVTGSDGAEHLAVEAAVAESEAARREGLAGYDELDDDRGLLIVLPVEGEVCITNSGVGFAIDAVFAADDGTVVAVERNVPMGDVTLRCHVSTRRILEVAAGVASSVDAGDQLLL